MSNSRASAFLSLLILHSALAGPSAFSAPDDIPDPAPAQKSDDSDKSDDKKKAVIGAVIAVAAVVAIAGGKPSPAAKAATKARCDAVNKAGPGGAKQALKGNPPGSEPAPAKASQHRIIDSPQSIPKIDEKLTNAEFPSVCSKLSLASDANLCQQIMGKLVTDLKKYWTDIQEAALKNTNLNSPLAGQLFPGQSGDYGDSILKDVTATGELKDRQAHEDRFIQIVGKLMELAAKKAEEYKTLGKSPQAEALQISDAGKITGATQPIINAIVKKFETQIAQWKFKENLQPPATEMEKEEAKKLIKSDVDKLVRRRVVTPEWQVWASAEAYLKEMQDKAKELKEAADGTKTAVVADAADGEKSKDALKSGDPATTPAAQSAAQPEADDVPPAPVASGPAGSRTNPYQGELPDAGALAEQHHFNSTGPHGKGIFALGTDEEGNPAVLELSYCPK